MKKLLLATAAVVSLAAGAAQAQTSDFTGFHIGMYGGGASARDEEDETVRFDRDLNGRSGESADAFPNFSPGFSGGAARGNAPAAGVTYDNSDDLVAGFRVGYDTQFAGWLVGGVVELEANSLSDSVSAFSTTPASYTMTRRLNGVAAARLRAGRTFGRFLGYGTAGYARADMDRSFTTTNTANTFTQSEDGKTDGFQVGAGVETRVGANVSLGLEYLYTRLNDDEFTVRASGGPAGGPFTAVNAGGTDFQREDTKFDYHGLRATAAFRF